MNEQAAPAGVRSSENDASVVRHVVLFSLLLLGVLGAGSYAVYGESFACSILIGGLLVNGSFWLLKKDAQRLMQRLSEADGASDNIEKTRFFLRSFARLLVLSLLLFVLASQVTINVIGLTLGFATVMVSVVIIGLSAGRCSVPSKA
jgi:hypothetical protein